MNLSQFKSKLKALTDKYHSTDEDDDSALEKILDQTLDLISSFKPDSDSDKEAAHKLVLDLVDYADEDFLDGLFENRGQKSFKQFIKEDLSSYLNGLRKIKKDGFGSISRKKDFGKVQTLLKQLPDGEVENLVGLMKQRNEFGPAEIDIVKDAVDSIK